MVSVQPTDSRAKTSLPELAEWVSEIAELTKPDAVVWCDGSQEEWDRLTTQLVDSGTFVRNRVGECGSVLNKSRWSASRTLPRHTWANPMKNR